MIAFDCMSQYLLYQSAFNHFTDVWKVESLCGVMAKVLDCGPRVSEFTLQSRYYVNFQTNTLGKGMNSFIPPPAMGLIVSLLFFCKVSFGIR